MSAHTHEGVCTPECAYGYFDDDGEFIDRRTGLPFDDVSEETDMTTAKKRKLPAPQAVGTSITFGKYLVLRRLEGDHYRIDHVPSDFEVVAFRGVSGEACRAVARDLEKLGEAWNVDPEGDKTPIADLHLALIDACERQKLERYQSYWRPRAVEE